jgi:hypothetical protein
MAKLPKEHVEFFEPCDGCKYLHAQRESTPLKKDSERFFCILGQTQVEILPGEKGKPHEMWEGCWTHKEDDNSLERKRGEYMTNWGFSPPPWPRRTDYIKGRTKPGDPWWEKRAVQKFRNDNPNHKTTAQVQAEVAAMHKPDLRDVVHASLIVPLAEKCLALAGMDFSLPEWPAPQPMDFSLPEWPVQAQCVCQPTGDGFFVCDGHGGPAIEPIPPPAQAKAAPPPPKPAPTDPGFDFFS